MRIHNRQTSVDLMPGAEGWQTSNAPVLNMAALLAALAEFREAGMDRLREKSLALTAFLERGIHSVAASTGAHLEILTPENPEYSASIITIRFIGMDNAKITKALRQTKKELRVRSIYENNIDGIRISFSIFNTIEEIDYLLMAINEIITEE